MCVVPDIFRFQMSSLLIYSIVETLFCVFSLFACCTAIVPCSTAAVNKKYTKNSIFLSKNSADGNEWPPRVLPEGGDKCVFNPSHIWPHPSILPAVRDLGIYTFMQETPLHQTGLITELKHFYVVLDMCFDSKISINLSDCYEWVGLEWVRQSCLFEGIVGMSGSRPYNRSVHSSIHFNCPCLYYHCKIKAKKMPHRRGLKKKKENCSWLLVCVLKCASRVTWLIWPTGAEGARAEGEVPCPFLHVHRLWGDPSPIPGAQPL